jgi:hypothetical protein
MYVNAVVAAQRALARGFPNRPIHSLDCAICASTPASRNAIVAEFIMHTSFMVCLDRRDERGAARRLAGRVSRQRGATIGPVAPLDRHLAPRQLAAQRLEELVLGIPAGAEELTFWVQLAPRSAVGNTARRVGPVASQGGRRFMPSKQVTDREKSARAVTAAAETHAASIAQGFARELTPYLKAGEAMPDVALLVRLSGRKVLADHSTLSRADHEHELELADDAGPREAREESAGKVRGVLLDLRAALDAIYGARGLSLLGLSAAVPVDPSVVATTAGNVHKALLDPKIKLPKPKRAGMKLERADFAAELGGELPALQKALAKVAKEEREKEATQRAKNEAMAKNDATFTTCAGFVAASCQLAGLPDIAAKVRPSGRRPGQTATEDTEGETEAEPETPADPPPTGAG